MRTITLHFPSAMKRQGASIKVLARASGVLPRPATILDAISKALQLCQGETDITTDSKVAVKQQQSKTLGKKYSMDQGPSG